MLSPPGNTRRNIRKRNSNSHPVSVAERRPRVRRVARQLIRPLDVFVPEERRASLRQGERWALGRRRRWGKQILQHRLARNGRVEGSLEGDQKVDKRPTQSTVIT